MINLNRELNLLNLNGKSITFKLKNKHLKKLKNKIISKKGLYGVSKTHNLAYSYIWQAINRNSFPLYILNILVDRYNLENIAKQIIAYKSYGGKKWIKNPKLIIKESKELTEILGHCLGDGYVTVKKSRVSSYTNTSKKLVKDFKALCKKVFGAVNLTTYTDKRFDAETVTLPKVMSIIISEFYPEILTKKIPDSLFTLPNEKIIPLLRAFADDESCVTTSAIYYTQKDKSVLDAIRKLHIQTGFKKTNLTEVKNRGDIHNFSIIGKGLIYFHENVKYKHPDKMKYLGIEIDRKKNKRVIKKIDTTKQEITQFLNTPKTSKMLSALIGVQPSRIRKHLKRLEFEGYVKIISHRKYKVPLWARVKAYKLKDERRRNRILSLLKKEELSTLMISKKMGLSKDRLLNYLHELNKENKIKYQIVGRTYKWYKI